MASNSLATMLARKGGGKIDGFVVELPTAGGHNAPPRGDPSFNERGEPVYGPRDEVDLAKIKELGLPFWVAGGMGSAAHLRTASAAGAAGIQVGTLFAFCEESGLDPALRSSVLSHADAWGGGRDHERAGVTHRVPVQGDRLARESGAQPAHASASATWGISARRIARPTVHSDIAVRANRSRPT